MDEINPVQPPAKGERDYLRFLVHAGEVLSSSLDVRETIMNICAAAVETVADMCYLIAKNPGGELEIIGLAARDASALPDMADAGQFLHSEPGYPPNIAGGVIDRGHIVFVADITDRYIDEYATSPEHAAFLRRMKYASIIVVPIPGRGNEMVGALGLVRTHDSDERFDENSVLFARGLARRCGSAMLRAREFESSQDVGLQFQRAALPRSLPSVSGVAFDAYYEAAEASLLIGGDWYDAFMLPTGNIGMTMGDIAGHGVEAATLMGNVRNALRTALCAGLALDAALDVVDFLVRGDLPEGGYATANLATLDPTSGVIRLIAAGHPGPLVAFSDDSVKDPFTDRGLPLGLRDLSRERQPVAELQLEKGSFLAFFTDGVIEWQRDELSGYARLRTAMSDRSIRHAERPALALRRAVVQGPHADDIAIMCVRYER
ncbi:MAG: SpoIIE family protein phosphatase [Candidatus Eremiobacteraeota bacterium]|nr:SpoIIE family protein phosphatase [Candidatus Eremiobacteraeota bacterium]